MPDQGACFIVLGRSEQGLEVVDLNGGAVETRLPNRGRCTVIRIEKFTYHPSETRPLSVATSFSSLRSMMPGLLLTAFLTNLLGLLPPLLIMAIYDRVIPSGSVDLLMALVIGVGVLAVSDFLFRRARFEAFAYVGQKGERKLAIGLFRKLMSLPLSHLQKSDVTQQIARFRQFESLRELFTGQVMTTVIDLPFAVIFFAVLLYLAPTVGLMTLGLAVLLLAIGAIALPFQQRLDLAAAEANAAHSSVVQNAVVHQRALVNLGLQSAWLDRCAPLAEAAETATAKARQLRNLIQNMSQAIMGLGSAGAIVISAHQAVQGSMTFGALIASIALVSKVLAPVQALQSSLGQIVGFRKSQTQADRVLALPEEMELGLRQSHQKTLKGAISFQGVGYRPDPLNPALLSGAGFDCAPGEVVVVMSRDTATRTAILDLISGLASPSMGGIEHDGIDIRQIARDELRKSVSYATYAPRLFYGTVAQNFRLAAPALSDRDMRQALGAIGVRKEIEALEEGYQTRLNDKMLASLPAEIIKSLTLARSMARPSSICLFSEPTNGLNQKRRRKFKTWVEQQRGEKTVIIATADRSFMQMADRLIFLNGDRVVVNDTGPAAIKKTQAVLKALDQ
ncbi:ABC transporter transmembrane domain-containing protein [Phaeobacter sp.]|uniref:ABC transporter transmembrane domain-containing protein n=1 Tax=Phaeobacter sp. TaxID=1902409 RepID=UPI0025E5E32A|nr:ABC transporter transmembrane domain-containing protein [Phaeobacter sp.]